MAGRYYGEPLKADVKAGRLVISIGVQTLAHAVAYAEWANRFDGARNDYFRTFAIEDEQEFANDVARAITAEREDGSSLLTDLLDKAAEEAINDGSLGLADGEFAIQTGEFDPVEKWAAPAAQKGE